MHDPLLITVYVVLIFAHFVHVGVDIVDIREKRRLGILLQRSLENHPTLIPVSRSRDSVNPRGTFEATSLAQNSRSAPSVITEEIDQTSRRR